MKIIDVKPFDNELKLYRFLADLNDDLPCKMDRTLPMDAADGSTIEVPEAHFTLVYKTTPFGETWTKLEGYSGLSFSTSPVIDSVDNPEEDLVALITAVYTCYNGTWSLVEDPDVTVELLVDDLQPGLNKNAAEVSFAPSDMFDFSTSGLSYFGGHAKMYMLAPVNTPLIFQKFEEDKCARVDNTGVSVVIDVYVDVE